MLPLPVVRKLSFIALKAARATAMTGGEGMSRMRAT